MPDEIPEGPEAATHPADRSSSSSPTRPWLLALIAGLVSALALLPGLLEPGLWSRYELPVFDHARALMGETVTDVPHMPWLSSWARAWAIALLHDPAALRLPGALATCGTVGLTVWIARIRGAGTPVALLAGGFVLAFPGVVQQARVAIGNPIGEFLATLAVAAGLHALARRPAPQWWSALLAGLLCVAALVLGTTASGVVLGALIPLLAIGFLSPRPLSDRVPTWLPATVLWLAALGIASLAARLALHQGEGYIPILGAAQHLDIMSRPAARQFAQIIEDVGFQMFPWLPIMALGALATHRDRWPTMWLLSGFTICGLWTLLYGRIAIPLAVPAALCCAAAIAEFTDAHSSRAVRRFAVLVGLAGFLILAKDAGRTPSRVGMPITDRRGEHNYAAAEIGADAQLPRSAKLAALGLLLAFLVAPAPSSAQDPRWRRRLMAPLDALPEPARALAPVGVVFVILGIHTAGAIHLQNQTALHESPMRALKNHQALIADGQLPETLALGQVRDAAIELYGPPPEHQQFLRGHSELTSWLSAAEPAAALIRASDLPFLTQQHRADGWPLFVLDHSNRNLALVSNVLPPGFDDENPLYAVLRDAVPDLPGGHTTLVQFEGLLDVVAWRVSGSVVRGRDFDLELVLVAHGKLPATTEIYARLQQGRVSRINPLPQQIAENLYPPKHWREGDIIVHRVTIQAPALEVLPGDHQLVVGLRRTKTANFEITIPADKTGAHDVTIIDKRRNFAAIGTVPVY